jgi:hypothetical protein
MYNFDFNAHNDLANRPKNDVQLAIQQANEKAHHGRYLVCETNAGLILVLPERSAEMRSDIANTLYDTEAGYTFSSNAAA